LFVGIHIRAQQLHTAVSTHTYTQTYTLQPHIHTHTRIHTRTHAHANKHIDRSEGDVNISIHRKEFERTHIPTRTQTLLREDAQYFMHQSLSTPCLNAIQRVDGIYIYDVEGIWYICMWIVSYIHIYTCIYR